ncbi:hypothetical protein NL676_006674 [Syzygium grande]|nr:hypothetical protein NL676_006674 [Syzygium grande]
MRIEAQIRANTHWHEALIVRHEALIARLGKALIARRDGLIPRLAEALIARSEGTVADNARYGPQLRGKKLSEGEVYKLLNLVDLDSSRFSRGGSELSVGRA